MVPLPLTPFLLSQILLNICANSHKLFSHLYKIHSLCQLQSAPSTDSIVKYQHTGNVYAVDMFNSIYQQHMLLNINSILDINGIKHAPHLTVPRRFCPIGQNYFWTRNSPSTCNLSVFRSSLCIAIATMSDKFLISSSTMQLVCKLVSWLF